METNSERHFHRRFELAMIDRLIFKLKLRFCSVFGPSFDLVAIMVRFVLAACIAPSLLCVESEAKQPMMPIEEINRQLRVHPNDVNLLSKRGDAKLFATEDRLAIRDYDRVLAIDPYYAWARLQRARCYFHLGRFTEEESELQKMIKLGEDGHHPEFTKLLGQAAWQLSKRYVRTNRGDELVALWNKVIETTHDAIDYLRKGEAEAELGKYQLAYSDLNAGLKRLPGDIDAIRWKARACLHLKKFDESIVCYTKCIEAVQKSSNDFLSKNNYVLFDERAEAYKGKGDLKLAEADTKRSKAIVDSAYDLAPFRQ